MALEKKRNLFDIKFANFAINLNFVCLVLVIPPARLTVNLFSVFTDKFSKFRQNASVLVLMLTTQPRALKVSGLNAKCECVIIYNLDKMSTMCVLLTKIQLCTWYIVHFN